MKRSAFLLLAFAIAAAVALAGCGPDFCGERAIPVVPTDEDVILDCPVGQRVELAELKGKVIAVCRCPGSKP